MSKLDNMSKAQCWSEHRLKPILSRVLNKRNQGNRITLFAKSLPIPKFRNVFISSFVCSKSV